MPIDREQALKMARKWNACPSEKDCQTCNHLADLIERVQRETAEECAQIVNQIESGTPFLLDTAILRIRNRFGLKWTKRNAV